MLLKNAQALDGGKMFLLCVSAYMWLDLLKIIIFSISCVFSGWASVVSDHLWLQIFPLLIKD